MFVSLYLLLHDALGAWGIRQVKGVWCTSTHPNATHALMHVHDKRGGFTSIPFVRTTIVGDLHSWDLDLPKEGYHPC